MVGEACKQDPLFRGRGMQRPFFLPLLPWLFGKVSFFPAGATQ